MQIPFCVFFPIGVFELVLHIKQPNANHCSQKCGWQKDEQNGRKAAKIINHRNACQNPKVRCHRAYPKACVFHVSNGKAVLQEKQIGWADDEQGDGVKIEAIFQSAEAGSILIFTDGQCIDVTNPTFR